MIHLPLMQYWSIAWWQEHPAKYHIWRHCAIELMFDIAILISWQGLLGWSIGLVLWHTQELVPVTWQIWTCPTNSWWWRWPPPWSSSPRTRQPIQLWGNVQTEAEIISLDSSRAHLDSSGADARRLNSKVISSSPSSSLASVSSFQSLSWWWWSSSFSLIILVVGAN